MPHELASKVQVFVDAAPSCCGDFREAADFSTARPEMNRCREVVSHERCV